MVVEALHLPESIFRSPRLGWLVLLLHDFHTVESEQRQRRLARSLGRPLRVVVQDSNSNVRPSRSWASLVSDMSWSRTGTPESVVTSYKPLVPAASTSANEKPSKRVATGPSSLTEPRVRLAPCCEGGVSSPTAVDVSAVIDRHDGHATMRLIDAIEDAKIASTGGVQPGELALQLVTDALRVGR